ncbi:hypothetical protein NHX12_023460 [Muraenolepis orangiensis]|uniref:Uncharacterized protein n=1 Tax=Muraenolepis orangiensis TaxID=630683 RepID=A0A9Q0EJH5_9TELE|nr:hypothetical protein NHX12_023460 [Muraenolepis orangiensis]
MPASPPGSVFPALVVVGHIVTLLAVWQWKQRKRQGKHAGVLPLSPLRSPFVYVCGGGRWFVLVVPKSLSKRREEMMAFDGGLIGLELGSPDRDSAGLCCGPRTMSGQNVERGEEESHLMESGKGETNKSLSGP